MVNSRQILNPVLRFFFLLVLLTLALFPSSRSTVRAAFSAQQGGGIQVEGAIIEITGKPSTVHVHKMTVGINSQSPAMEVTVEATGFGVTKEGEFQAIPANKDTSPYSARTFITAISRTSFKLNPGEKVPVEVTLSLPPEMGANTRYAAVYVSSSAVGGGGGVGQVFAVVVPVVITPMGALQNRTGIINQILVKDRKSVV